MVNIVIDEEWCKGCYLCVHFCPKKIFGKSKRRNGRGIYPAPVDRLSENCSSCKSCELICPELAITVEKEKGGMRKEVKMAGFGGQGIVLMGVILAEAAGYYEDLEIAQTQSYGPEARGGACRAEVVLSDEIIDYTKTLNADVFVAMSQPALDRYLPEIDPSHAQVFVDDTLVTEGPCTGDPPLPCTRYPAWRRRNAEIGWLPTSSCWGWWSKKTGLLSIESLKSTLQERLSPKMREINLNALEVALRYEQGESWVSGISGVQRNQGT